MPGKVLRVISESVNVRSVRSRLQGDLYERLCVIVTDAVSLAPRQQSLGRAVSGDPEDRAGRWGFIFSSVSDTKAASL